MANVQAGTVFAQPNQVTPTPADAIASIAKNRPITIPQSVMCHRRHII
ncbi:hypothetical protein [Nostoc commune]|nr:hypothetical protein [Nostoc commune]